MKAFAEVTNQEAMSYGELKKELGYHSDDAFLEYVKMKTITGYNKKNLIVAEPRPAVSAKTSKADPTDKGNLV